jgi:hypothetical protein
VEYFIPLFLGIEAVRRDRKNLDFFLKICVLVVLVVFVYGFGQKHFGWPIIITQNEEYSKGVALRWIPGSHINSTFAGHYDLASYLVLLLPIFINLLFKLKNYKEKLILFLAIFAGLWLLVNSASRISLASYLVSVSLGLLFIRKIKFIPIVVVISVIFVMFSSNLLDRYTRLFQVVKENFVQFNKINYELLLPNVYASEDLTARRSSNTPTPTPPPVFEDRSTNIRLNVEY